MAGGSADDDLGGSLDLARGSSIAEHSGPSAYSGGASFGDDDPFADDVPESALELDDAARPEPNVPVPVPAPPPPAAQPPTAPPRKQPDAAAAMIARYPTPPAKPWETPGYALRVLFRQYELRQDLASLRRRRSPDVPLYERALATHDAKSFTIGLAITCAALLLASVIFFLPVILRFAQSPD